MWSLGVAKAYVTKNTAAGNGHDTAITQLADGVSSRIENFIRRKIVKRAITSFVLDGPDCNGKISLPDYPIFSVEAVKIRPSMNVAFPAALDSSAYELDARHGFIYLLSSSGASSGLYPFEFSGRRLVSVDYTPGWDQQDGAALPRDLYGMGLDYCKFLYQRWANDLIVSQNVSEGGKNITIPQDLPKDLRDAFSHYIKRRI
jgi:hypothetical protein